MWNKPPAIEPNSILQLPDDLVLSCLAHVPRLHYPILSLVSKTFRSLTSSPELYQTRYLLNRTEGCPYVCLQFPSEPNLRWFTLCRKPDKTLNKKKTESSSGHVLAEVQIHNSPPVEWSDLVAVGHRLYAINKEDDVSCCSSNVFFLDCRTHTWVETPSLRFAQTKRKLDGMMYLAGSNENPDSLNCLEVFNTETQTWKPVPEEKRIFRDTDFKGNVYKNLDRTSGERVSLVVNLKDSTTDFVGSGTICVIEKRFYLYLSTGVFLWSNTEFKSFGLKKVQGLEGLPKFGLHSNVKLVDCGGKLVVFWDEYVPAPSAYKEKMIWCAEISLEIRSSEEVWGNVEWFDAVFKVPKSYRFVYATAATV
ncbi:putative F-box/kelch-repeat protein [Raphanus sativus]|uniref:F-box/kelch-repeat protein At4g39600 n=1 Tax=Raphanus sativus TaxID=3726 RepID=A0A6J0MQ71_RAPSA|nr:putative F-box/kelch-repeat protein At4g39600 [Raphanus sativus]KAJ4905785.1 putative F-box/kelch-repeat protein [Raphanus sativus]